MLEEIAQTDPGEKMVKQVREEGWTIRYGDSKLGGGFTYSWKVITIHDEFGYTWARGALSHELVHATKYGGTVVDSIWQEFEATYYEKCISAQLGSISEDAWNRWFGPDADPQAIIEDMRNMDAWHYDLPYEQPEGWDAWWYAFLQIQLWKLWQDAPQPEEVEGQ
jgi:hypothetical protein